MLEMSEVGPNLLKTFWYVRLMKAIEARLPGTCEIHEYQGPLQRRVSLPTISNES